MDEDDMHGKMGPNDLFSDIDEDIVEGGNVLVSCTFGINDGRK